MKEAGGRECGESRVEDQGSCKLNEMEGRCESDCGRDEVYPATFGDEERTGLNKKEPDCLRTLKVCSKSKLKEEINRIKEILLNNGYPEDFVLKQISKKITQFSRPQRFGPDKCPVYLRVT